MVTTTPSLERDHVYLLVGKTKAGKSTLCNYFTGSEAFKVLDDCNSCTAEAQFQPKWSGIVDGTKHSVTLIDTIGLYDTRGTSNNAAMRSTVKAICSNCQYINGIIIMNRENGLTKEEIKTFNTVRALLNSEARNEIPIKTVLTYKGPRYTDEQVVTKIQAYSAHPDFKDYMEKVTNDIIFVNIDTADDAVALRNILLGNVKSVHKSKIIVGIKGPDDIERYNFFPSYTCSMS